MDTYIFVEGKSDAKFLFPLIKEQNRVYLVVMGGNCKTAKKVVPYVYASEGEGSKFMSKMLDDEDKILFAIDLYKSKSIKEVRNEILGYLKKKGLETHARSFNKEKDAFLLPQNDDKNGNLEKLMMGCLKEGGGNKEYNEKLRGCLVGLEDCFKSLVETAERKNGKKLLDPKHKLYIYASSFKNRNKELQREKEGYYKEEYLLNLDSEALDPLKEWLRGHKMAV